MKRKGSELLKKRNEKIVTRFNELIKVKKINYTEAINMLSEEFFKMPETIQKIICKTKKES